MSSHARLLVVDDDADNCDQMSRRLRRAGYEVDAVGSGHEAVEAVERDAYDLVLLDAEIPALGGLAVLKVLRARRDSTRLAVVMVTARTRSEDLVEALEFGADDYVTKPIDMPVLLARVRRQLGRLSIERQLHERQDRFDLAAQGANDGLWDWKVHENQAYFSPRWKAILGGDDCSIENRIDAWFERIHPADAAAVHRGLDRHLQGDTLHFESEHRLRHTSGAYRWVRCRAAAVRDDQGRPIRIAGSLADITDGTLADPLTGLANRTIFLDRVQRLIEYRARAPEVTYAVLLVDVDRFTLINETLGHVAGDQLLVSAGQRLEQCFRVSDTVARVLGDPSTTGNTIARLGGDEFAIALSHLHPDDDVRNIARRVVDALSKPFALADRDVFVSVSVGIAGGSSDYHRAEEILHDADTAMYYAKTHGKNSVEVFDSVLRARALARLDLETGLRFAIDRGELVVHYQPVVNLATGSVVSFEALLRWNHPGRGLLVPGQFIDIAEESGLIQSIGEWVLGQACRQLCVWEERGMPVDGLTMAVNLSPRQFADPELVRRVARVLRETGADPAHIELELTESAIMASPESAREVLHDLKSLGVRLSIDDFGSGYSSLAHLQRFPVDRLKVDKVFVSGAAHSTEHAQVLATIVTLARELELEVVAEGIETQTQLLQLQALACDLGQGCYFSAPVPQNAVEQLLRRHPDRQWHRGDRLQIRAIG